MLRRMAWEYGKCPGLDDIEKPLKEPWNRLPPDNWLSEVVYILMI